MKITIYTADNVAVAHVADLREFGVLIARLEAEYPYNNIIVQTEDGAITLTIPSPPP